jgi:serine/threonine protein phosphatase PrpC
MSESDWIGNYPNISLTAINHHLEVSGLCPEAAARQQLIDALSETHQYFSAAYAHPQLDIVTTATPASLSFIFHTTVDQSQIQLSNANLLATHLKGSQYLWNRLEIVEFPVNQLCNSHYEQVVVTLIATLKPEINNSYPEISALSRPMPGNSANGDGYWAEFTNNTGIICVVDGLGHGDAAQEAQRLSIETVKGIRDEQLDVIFKQVHEAIRKTRGVAMTIGRINLADKSIEHAGIGNVELRMAPHDSGFISQAGVLGMGQLPRIKVTRSLWDQDSLLVIYSDGLHGKWSTRNLQQVASTHPLLLSHTLLRCFEKDNDDATVLVVTGGSV